MGALRKRIYLTKEQEEALLREYPTADIEELMARYGFSCRKNIYMFAERRGLKRDEGAKCRSLSNVLSAQNKSERRRLRWGLPQKTRKHLPVKAFVQKHYRYRSKMLRMGYILGDYRRYGERFSIFYNEKTNRSEKVEANAIKAGFRIKRLEE